MTELTDVQLVEKAKQGDSRAFDLLVLKYQHRIMALVSRFVSDSHEIQDVTQEAFIKAYRALPNFRGDSAFYTWVYRIAINTAKNYLVSRNRKPSSGGVDVDDATYLDGGEQLRDIQTPENSLASEQLQAVINEAIQSLPEDLRVALTLREYDGLSYEEIAQVMDCPVGTVRSRIFRAREVVEKNIKPLVTE